MGVYQNFRSTFDIDIIYSRLDLKDVSSRLQIGTAGLENVEKPGSAYVWKWKVDAYCKE